MGARGDRWAPKVGKRLIADFGALANLESVADNTVSTGIRITPPAEREVYMGDTRVREVVSECLVAANDPNLASTPRPGDYLYWQSPRALTLIPGTGPEYSGEQVAYYRLRWRG